MKPIETVYGGYRFRSRLEARWAVFYDALHISYRYEPEGYDLDGVRYLPDFWLPELDCWIEVKGQYPMREEREKAQLLAWHGGKDVHIFYGDVWKPSDDTPHAEVFTRIEVRVKPQNASPRSERQIELTPDLAIIMSRICNFGCMLSVNPQAGTILIEDPVSLTAEESLLKSLSCLLPVCTVQKYFDRKARDLPPLVEQLELHKQEFLTSISAVMPVDDIIQAVVYGGGEGVPYEWIVCKQCKRAHLHNDYTVHRQCSCFGEDCQGDEEYLHAAYLAARQARFEYR